VYDRGRGPAIGPNKDKRKGMVKLDSLKAWLEETKNNKLERMDAFFESKLGGYEEHMSVMGEYYEHMAQWIPEGTKTLLDLGCGTGLELDRIFKRFPDMEVTGIDLSKAMLEQLEKKHGNKKLTLFCTDYFTKPFGRECFDAAVSFQTLHHYRPEKKLLIFQKVYQCLKYGACYIECDYVAKNQEEEDLLFAEAARRRERDGIPEDVFVHFDTPLTLEHEIEIIRQAGFDKVSVLEITEDGHTALVVAAKNRFVS